MLSLSATHSRHFTWTWRSTETTFMTVSTISVGCTWERDIFAFMLTSYELLRLSVPFWELSYGLSSLSVDFGMEPSFEDYDEDDDEEQFEETFEEIEVPLESPPRTARAKDEFHRAIACRTIIAAAKGCRLRRLRPTLYMQHPFAIRSLIWAWVLIDDWEEIEIFSDGWLRAATTFRSLLSHASLWLGTTPGLGAREERQLTTQEIQSLQAHFRRAGPPKPFHDMAGERKFVTGRYLPWLAEDEELATLVSTAWNVVVEKRRGADLLKCDCNMCNGVA